MRLITISKFVREEETFDWIIDDLLPDVGWTLLVGQQGLGKSTFAAQMCAAIQEGQPFLNRKVSKRNILYVQADSPTAEWREMLRRIAPRSKGWTVVDVPAKCLGNESYVNGIASVVQKVEPGFIVFDSLYNLTPSNINTEAVLTPVNTMKMLSKVDNKPVPWLLIHHPPHGESRAAGHHSLAANCSNEWVLLKTKLKINKGRLVADKEVLLSRDDKGLWHYKKSAVESGDYSLDFKL